MASAHEKILGLRGNTYEAKNLNAHMDELLTVASTYDTAAIKSKLQQIVPDYTLQL